MVFAQGFFCALEKGLDAGSRPPHDLGDFVDGKVFEGLEQERVALIGRQCLDGPTKGHRRFEIGGVGLVRVEGFVAATFSIDVGELATGDSVEPATRGDASGAPSAHSGGECLGRKVLGVLGIADSARKIAIDGVEMIFKEIFDAPRPLRSGRRRWTDVQGQGLRYLF